MTDEDFENKLIDENFTPEEKQIIENESQKDLKIEDFI